MQEMRLTHKDAYYSQPRGSEIFKARPNPFAVPVIDPEDTGIEPATESDDTEELNLGD